MITDGKIKLGRTAPDGRENILAVLGPGEMFGELSLFDPEPRTATAIAVVDSTLMSLGHEDLDALLTGRPAVAESMLAALAQRLRRTNESWPISSSATCPVGSPRRCSICRRDSVCGLEEGLHVTHDLTQEELAQLVGASRETVNKALADFASRGVDPAGGASRRHSRRGQACPPGPLRLTPARPPGAALAEVVELRPDGQFRGRPQHRVDIDIHPSHHLRGRARRLGPPPHLVEALEPVREVEVEHLKRVRKHRPCPGRTVVTCARVGARAAGAARRGSRPVDRPGRRPPTCHGRARCPR